MQAEGDVDDSFFRKALQIGDQGTFEVCGRGGVAHVDPAHSFLGVQEVHGRGLLGAGGQQAVDGGAAQGRGLDVLGVGDQQDGQALYGDWKRDTGVSKQATGALIPAAASLLLPFLALQERLSGWGR